jgi:hypothetical protein
MGKSVTALMGLILLGGCASAPPLPVNHYDPSLSKAMNIAIAGGVIYQPARHALSDLTAAELAPALGTRPAQGGTGVAVNTGYAVANVLNPPPGIGLGLAGTVSVVSLLLPDPKHPAALDHTLVWLPAVPGESLETALAKADASYTAASLRAFTPQDKLVTTTEQPLLGPAYEATWRVGPGCPRDRCEVLTNLLRQWAKQRGPLEVVQAPRFLTRQSPVWGRTEWRDSATVNIAHSALGMSDSLPAMQRLSAELPDWVFLYLAPKTGRNPVPLILTQGQPLYFIKPGEEAAAGMVVSAAVKAN